MFYIAQKRKRYDKQFMIAAERMVLGGEMRAVDLARGLGTKDSALGGGRRSAGEMGEGAIMDAEANQLCSRGPTATMVSHVIRRLGKSRCWAHAHYVRNRQNCRQGCCGAVS